MPPAFLELSAVLVLATILGIVARVFHQPLILAYIFAGIIISILGVFEGFDRSALELFSNLGVAFLLFLVGIDLNLTDLRYVGRAALTTGLGQIIFTAAVGFVLISALGFGTIPALYMAVALTFSSTVIIIKLLSEKHDLQSLYGKIAVGFLLVQDFVAILALMFLTGFGTEAAPTLATFLGILIKGVLLVGLAYIASKTFLKFMFKLTSTSVELLVVSAIAWAFLSATVGAAFGFSIAIGAFLAGLAIASSPYRIEISARVKPLRDFFLIIFFILLGASMALGASGVMLSHVIILSLFILVGNPLIVLAVMLTLGYRNRTSFLASVTVAQISEFSLILMVAGQALGHVGTEDVALVAAVGIVTITSSSYLILYGDRLYRLLQRPISRLFPEKKRDPYISGRQTLTDHVILVGAEQMGSDILKFLSKRVKDKKQIVVVDYNPEIITGLVASGYNAVFGDIADFEVLEELELARAKLVIITDPDIADNQRFIKFAKSRNFKGPVICTSYWMHDAVKLYEAGADYVIVPEAVGGEHVSQILAVHWDNLGKIKKARRKHFDELLSHKIF